MCSLFERGLAALPNVLCPQVASWVFCVTRTVVPNKWDALSTHR